ncbi:hypothetical protein [Rhodococcus sp. 114MFTsu3.1]|uniref:hypothetical protein n=1 Tax=Rhodococcus sp. 114MFTsu3.1 TaxID=1172184 RepID=UPI0003A1D826|nr:hypothetical protein [Rhodococcus sp. 114MFTsu3.1]
MGADFRVIRGVELAKVGRWEISTGTWDVSTADLESAVAAHAAGIGRRPVIRLGHIDPRFDGTPGVGWVDGLRLADGGRTLIGDLHGVPAWLAASMRSAYPSRSVEALQDVKAANGESYALVLTGLALLGATEPGIGTLKDLRDVQALYSGGRIAASGRAIQLVRASAPKPEPTATQRAALNLAASRRRARTAQRILHNLLGTE